MENTVEVLALRTSCAACIGLQAMHGHNFFFAVSPFFLSSFCNHEIRFSNFNENILEVLELSLGRVEVLSGLSFITFQK